MAKDSEKAKQTVEDDAKGIDRRGGKPICMKYEIWGLIKALFKYPIR